MKKTVTLNPGELATVAFEFTPPVAKVYSVNINGISGTFEAVAPPPVYKVAVNFTRERACEEGYMWEGKWVCTKYSGDEREAVVTIVNQGPAGRFTTVIACWLYLSGAPGHEFKTKQWISDFAIGQTRTYGFSYLVPTTGMPVDTRFFIKVYDPNGKIIADKVFITSL